MTFTNLIIVKNEYANFAMAKILLLNTKVQGLEVEEINITV